MPCNVDILEQLRLKIIDDLIEECDKDFFNILILEDNKMSEPVRKNVCIDLDATIATYNGWKGFDKIDDPRPGAKEFLEELSKIAKVVIFTTRTNVNVNGQQANVTTDLLVSTIVDWMKKHDLPYDEIYKGNGKPLAAAFVDDRNVAIARNPVQSDFQKALEEVKVLLTR
jgi:NLI interacting factor-like phosphatase